MSFRVTLIIHCRFINRYRCLRHEVDRLLRWHQRILPGFVPDDDDIGNRFFKFPL